MIQKNRLSIEEINSCIGCSNIKEVYKNIFCFPVVLPSSPLKSINIFIVKDRDRNLVFDTGYNTVESKMSMMRGFSCIGLEISDVDLILTHMHSDHTGLASFFSDAGCDVYASEKDGKAINAMATEEYWKMMDDLLVNYGIDSSEVRRIDNPGYVYRLDHQIDIKVLNPGDLIKTGEYEFEVLDLSGHTPGHIGLIERKHKILFCGDTVLQKITPNITFWGFENGDSLGNFIDTLNMLRKEDIEHCFSTHRELVTDFKGRVDEILKHHNDRMNEILDAMESGKEYTVREISSSISWRIKADSWDEFPPAQKYFASGETMSHLEHLVYIGVLNRKSDNGKQFYIKK